MTFRQARCLLVACALLPAVLAPAAASADPGRLDPSFGTNGRTVADVAGFAEAVAVDGSGRSVVAGQDPFAGHHFTLMRFTPGGAPDGTFGTFGRLQVPAGSSSGARAIAIDSSGRYVVAGFAHDGSGYRMAVARVMPSGAPDSAFGTDGVEVLPALGAGDDFGNAVAVQPDGTILVAGSAEIAAGDPAAAVVRLEGDGDLDTTFGSGGSKLIRPAGNDAEATEVIRLPSGDIAIGGSAVGAVGGSWGYHLIARLMPGGDFRSGWGEAGSGMATIDIQGPGGQGAADGTTQALARWQPPGGTAMLVSGGSGRTGQGNGFSLFAVRESDGSRVTALNGTLPFPGAQDGTARTLLPMGDRLVIAGDVDLASPARRRVALARVDAAGSLDGAFDGDGRVVSDFGGEEESAPGAAVSGDKVVVAGHRATSASDWGTRRFLVARYDTQISPPSLTTLPARPSGTPRSGETLTADRGSWSGSGLTYEYTWERCPSTQSCSPVAHGATYRLAGADVGNRMRVVVTARNAAGASHAASPMTDVVTSPPPPPPPPAPPATAPSVDKPVVSGEPKVGGVLRIAVPQWRGETTEKVIGWQRCQGPAQNPQPCEAISPRANERHVYDVTGDDLGSRIRVVLYAYNKHGFGLQSSDVTAIVQPGAPQCQNRVEWGTFEAVADCFQREGLTWWTTGTVKVNGLSLVPATSQSKIVLDPFNLRIAATGKVRVQLGPAYVNTAFNGVDCALFPNHGGCYKLGPVVLYEGAFDWNWQAKVRLPDLPRFALPTGAASLPSLPKLPGLDFGRLPQLQIPNWGGVDLPDLSKLRGPDLSQLRIPSLNLPHVQIPENLIPNWQLPQIGLGTSPGNLAFGFPFQGRAGLQLVERNGVHGAAVELAVQLPKELGGVSGLAKLFIGSNGSFSADQLRFAAPNVPLGPFGFRDIVVEYQAQHDLWSGGAWVDLPFPPPGLSLRADAGFKGGRLVNADAGFESNFPVGATGVFIYGGRISLKTVPRRTIGGTISGGVGPQVRGAAAVRVDGSLGYTFADPGYQGFFRLGSQIHLLNHRLSSGEVTFFDGGDIDFWADYNQAFGDLGIKGRVDGWIQAKRFNVDGVVTLKVPGYEVAANGTVSHIGAGACVAMKGLFGPFELGGTYKWGAQSPNIMWESCSIGPIKAKKASVARAAGTVQTLDMPAGRGVEVLGFKGNGAPPKITLTGPDGSKIVTPAGPGAVRTDRFFLVQVPSTQETMIAVAKPAAGRWTAEVQDGSAPLQSLSRASNLPDPKVSAKVTGRGAERRLSYSVDVARGDTVRFVEAGPQVERPFAQATGRRSGVVRFTPVAGPAGVRKVVAVVERDGVARKTMTVARFRASRTARLGPPRRVKVRRRGTRLLASWTKVAGAQRYRVTLTTNGGRRSVVETRKRTLRVPNVFVRSSATVRVQAINALREAGRSRVGRLAAPKAKPVRKAKRKASRRRSR